MPMSLISIILYALSIGIGVTLVWGIPIYMIYREQYVPENEKLLWIIASILVPWVPFLVFMFIAPVTGPQSRS